MKFNKRGQNYHLLSLTFIEFYVLLLNFVNFHKISCNTITIFVFNMVPDLCLHILKLINSRTCLENFEKNFLDDLWLKQQARKKEEKETGK